MKRARAAVLAIMRADDPEMPAPAGDSESVSISRPSLGAKNCSRRAARGRRKRLLAQGFEAGKLFFAPGIERAQVDAFPFQRSDAAGGQDIDREIQGQRAGMEQIQRPKVDGPARQISTAGSLGDDGGAPGRAVFSHDALYPEG